MKVKSTIPKSVNYGRNCYKGRSNSFSYNVYESIKYEHIKAINHYSYTSPVKSKVLDLYNNKNTNQPSVTPLEDLKSYDNNSDFKIHQLEPNTGPAHGGIQVTIYGQGFYDGLYVVYGNCIIETEFIDSNTIKFYLPPNPKCFHYNGKKTVVEDLFVVDLYKSSISHAEFNTNISDSFNIMLEIIMKIVITRVCNNFNDLSFRKTENGTNTTNNDSRFLNKNNNLFNLDNSLINSLKSLQNSISCSFVQQEKAFYSFINKTKEYIPTFYISNNNSLKNGSPPTSLPNATSTLSTTTTPFPVIKININPSLSYYQPYCYYPTLNVQTIQINTPSLKLFNNNQISSTAPLPSILPGGVNPQSSTPNCNNNSTNHFNISLNSSNLLHSSTPIKSVLPSNGISSPTIISNTTNLNNEAEEMAIEGDDEMDEDDNTINKCTCNHSGNNVGIIPKSLHSYKNSGKSYRQRHQEIRCQEEMKKREHQYNYIEGKKIEKMLEDCIKKSNERKPIQPNEFLYSSQYPINRGTHSSTTNGSSKRSISVKITLIHLGIILCMTRLIYYILKYCKLCSRIQNCADDVSTKIHDIRNNVKKDNSCSFFTKLSSTSFKSTRLNNKTDVYPHPCEDDKEDDLKLNEVNTSSSSSSPSSSPTLSPSNLLTPSSSSNDSLPGNNNDTQLTTKSIKTKKRVNYLKIIDQGDTIGNTPLHYAIIAHSPALFNMLIEAGANINKENMYGQTVLDLAYSIGDDTMVELIEDHMNSSDDSEEDSEINPTYTTLLSTPLVDSGFSSGMNDGLI